jgi:hypothetical protein
MACLKFKHAFAFCDECHTISTWNFPSTTLLPKVIRGNLPSAVVVNMTGTSVFQDDEKEFYLRNTLLLKSEYFYLVNPCMRYDIQKLVIDLDLVTKSKDTKIQNKYLLEEIKRCRAFVKSIDSKLLVVCPTPGECIKLHSEYSIYAGEDINEIPLILGSNDQNSKDRQHAFASLNSDTCTMGIASPAIGLGATIDGLMITIEAHQNRGGYQDHQIGGRNNRQRVTRPLCNSKHGWAILFTSVGDCSSDDQFSSLIPHNRTVEITGRKIMRAMLAGYGCAQLCGIQQYQPTPSVDGIQATDPIPPCGLCLFCLNGAVRVPVTQDTLVVIMAIEETGGFLNMKRLVQFMKGDRKLELTSSDYFPIWNEHLSTFPCFGVLKCVCEKVLYSLLLKLVEEGYLVDTFEVIVESCKLKATRKRARRQVTFLCKKNEGRCFIGHSR